MIAVDTNVLVRVLVDDHPAQCASARRLWRTNRIWITKTVLQEAEWVLRSAMKAPREEIRHAFRLLMADPRVSVEDRAAVERAVICFGAGMDFADALHVASRGAAERFVTFDQRLVLVAGPMGEEVEPLG